MMAESFVSLEIEEHLARVTLDRADALNALSGAMADQIAATFSDLATREDVWVVVLRAAGDKAFCVGADLKERSSFSLDDFHANRRQIRGMFAAIRGLPQPSIASVFGFALGGGFELALSCDLIVAAEGTLLGLPEVRVGLIPAGGGTQLLTRRVGIARAKEMIFRGRRIDAEEAAAMGIVAEVVPGAFLDARTTEIALDICRSSPVGVRQAKRAIDAALGSSLEDGMQAEHDAWAQVIGTEDRAEGIKAFNEKRDPLWKNR